MIIENSGPGEKDRPVRIRTAVRRQGQVKQKELPLHAAPGRKDVDEKGVARFGTQHAAAETRLSKKRTAAAPPGAAAARVYIRCGCAQAAAQPAGGRVVYDYNKSAGASSGVPAGSPARPAAPFVNTAPQASAAGAGTARPPETARAFRAAAALAAGPADPRPGGGNIRPAAAFPGHRPRHNGARSGTCAVRLSGKSRAGAAGTGGGAEAAPGVYDQARTGPANPARKQRFARPARTPGHRHQGSGKAGKSGGKSIPPRPSPGEARRRRVRRGILAGVLIAVLLAAGFLISAAVLFKIETVTVESPDGQLAYDDSQIVAAFGQPAGENLFGFNTAEAQQAIAAALPYLESVEIKRRLPDTVVITATPAVETCTVESAAGWAVLSQSYKVLRVDAEAPAGLVRIDGAQADAPAPGQPVKFTEEDKLSVLQTVLSKAQAQGLGPISEVDLTNTLELSFLYQDRIRIVLGTANDLDYKIKWAWEMVTPGQTSDSLGEEERGTLDVSSRGEDGLGRARWRAGVL